MITKRPTLPTGHTIGGLPPVERVVHSDDRCEVYGLQALGEYPLLLLFASTAGGAAKSPRELAAWWAVQPAEVLKVIQSLAPEDCPPQMIGVAFEARGALLAHDGLRQVPEAVTHALHAMLDLVDRTLPTGLFPDLDPSLTLLSANGTSMASLLPIGGELPPEPELVQRLAAALYRYATGVDVQLMKGSAPPLTQWAKFASREVAITVDRCLATSEAKARISTLGRLNEVLGRMRSQAVAAEGRSSDSVPTQASRAARGLDKVAGMHALKTLLRRDVVDPVRKPEPYKRYGLSIPNGILLYGPPGCGKTYVARQLAEELDHYFVEIIPSELASPFIHQSVMRIREVFEDAAEHAPAVVFIDEFEALVPQRGDLGGHQQYKAEEVNEFLAHLNSCADRKIFIIAATNQPAKIDEAVRRTGRLDKLIYVGPPDPEARAEMLALHLEGRPVTRGLDLAELAKTLEGYSASDIRFLVDEAAREAMRAGRDVGEDSFRAAVARVHPSVTAEIEGQYRSIVQRGI